MCSVRLTYQALFPARKGESVLRKVADSMNHENSRIHREHLRQKDEEERFLIYGNSSGGRLIHPAKDQHHPVPSSRLHQLVNPWRQVDQ